MPKSAQRLALLWTLLLALCMLSAGAAGPQTPQMAPETASEAALTSMGEMPEADVPAGTGDSGEPVKMSAGVDDPEALHPEAPRRLDAPERQLADFGTVPSPRSRRDVRDRAVAADRSSGASPAPSLHLRHCVFLC